MFRLGLGLVLILRTCSLVPRSGLGLIVWIRSSSSIFVRSIGSIVVGCGQFESLESEDGDLVPLDTSIFENQVLELRFGVRKTKIS